jgi:Peptidase_C39 like family
VALSAFNLFVGPDDLATRLGTTPGGTDSAIDITRVLNGFLGPDRYKTTELPGKVASPEQIAKLQADIVAAVNQGKPVVANIAGTVRDTIGEVHSYPGGHYLTVFGYSENGAFASIADSADKLGGPEYQVSVADLAQWIASRGYSS